MSKTALDNEFFTNALTEWRDRLVDGKSNSGSSVKYFVKYLFHYKNCGSILKCSHYFHLILHYLIAIVMLLVVGCVHFANNFITINRIYINDVVIINRIYINDMVTINRIYINHVVTINRIYINAVVTINRIYINDLVTINRIYINVVITINRIYQHY